MGVISQQLEAIYPDFVNTYTDTDTYKDGIGTKAINTNCFSTFMMKGIQELIAENVSLKLEIASLQNNILDIKTYLNLI